MSVCMYMYVGTYVRMQIWIFIYVCNNNREYHMLCFPLVSTSPCDKFTL